MNCLLPGALSGAGIGCDGGGWAGTLALVAALAAFLAAGFQCWQARRGGRGRWVLALPVLAGLIGWLLALSAAGLWFSREAGREGRHLAVLVDSSASARRTPEQLPTTLARVAERVGEASRTADPRDSASVLFVADGSVAVHPGLPLASLAGALPGLAGQKGPAEGNSDLAAGIRAAARKVRDAGGGAILLASDGLQTRGDALEAAGEAGHLGIPVHVLPVASPSPGIGLMASHLPPRVAAGVETRLRLVVANPLDRAGRFKLRVQLNGEGTPVEAEAEVPAGTSGAVTIPVIFADRGLQFLDIDLTPAEGGASQRRRAYTLVDTPTRIAALGPAGWLSALPSDSYQVERHADGQPFALNDIDVVVIDGVPANRLAAGQAERILAAVKDNGAGLFLANGPHRGRDEDPTVLMGYEETALDPLLPVTSKPREMLVEPPGRQVVIMVDTSGSMCGQPLELAQRLGTHIVDQLRPRDSLTITSFASGYSDLLQNVTMSAAGKAEARAKLGSLACGGGTDPNSALQRLAVKNAQQCGLFFISDGEFSLGARLPGCMTTIFAIGQTESSVNRDMARMGEMHFINETGAIGGLRLGFMQPEKRPKHFEPGNYRPDLLLPGSMLLPDPPGDLDGNAVTFVRDGVELAATRPHPVDPVLAFLDSGTGTTGVFTTNVPAAWTSGAGARSVKAWMEHLVAWPQRDRYVFDLVEQDGVPTLLLSLTVQDGRVPLVEQVSASLRSGDGDQPLRSEQDPSAWGRFRLRLPAAPVSGAAMLVLRETGPDALDREQRIPIRLGTAAGGAPTVGSEQWSYGVDTALLNALASASGGSYDPSAFILGGTVPRPPAALPLWPWLLVLATTLYLALIALWRWLP